jgi:uncharacterized membrane protein (DUF485 family)
MHTFVLTTVLLWISTLVFYVSSAILAGYAKETKEASRKVSLWITAIELGLLGASFVLGAIAVSRTLEIIQIG